MQRMQAPELQKPPPDWAQYDMMGYFDALRVNQFATFHNKRIVVQDICRVDRLLADALHGWRDPPVLVPVMLLLRSHAAFRAGAGAAMAGQAAEAPCLLRLCLECAGYAAVIGEDQEIAEAFSRRSDSDAAKTKVKSAFNAGRIKAAVGALDAKLAKVFSVLYESLIDFGAHPNEENDRGKLSYGPGIRGDKNPCDVLAW
jgi:hypothetical protein